MAGACLPGLLASQTGTVARQPIFRLRKNLGN